ncbi:hypothetical protein MKY25_11445 [Geobacillus sp. FSL W8-0032]|uniref:hypothetical protein n=1 Tax=unclassified Geobacillus TaxID=2642459 RepID=UPI00103D3CF4
MFIQQGRLLRMRSPPSLSFTVESSLPPVAGRRSGEARNTEKIHGQRFGLHAGVNIAHQFRMFMASSMGSGPPSTEMKPLCQFRMFTEKTPRSMGRLSVRRYVPTAYCSASK